MRRGHHNPPEHIPPEISLRDEDGVRAVADRPRLELRFNIMDWQVNNAYAYRGISDRCQRALISPARVECVFTGNQRESQGENYG
jgi:hypothetical protein